MPTKRKWEKLSNSRGFIRANYWANVTRALLAHYNVEKIESGKLEINIVQHQLPGEKLNKVYNAHILKNNIEKLAFGQINTKNSGKIINVTLNLRFVDLKMEFRSYDLEITSDITEVSQSIIKSVSEFIKDSRGEVRLTEWNL